MSNSEPGLVDRVAAAICNAHCGDTDAWEITYDKGRRHWRCVAEAALEAGPPPERPIIGSQQEAT